MDRTLKIALILSAIDQMSSVVARATAATETKLQAFAKKANAISSKAFEFGRTTGALGLGAGALLLGPLKAAADMEKMNVALRTSFQGNNVAADAAFKTINAFAARTPYELEEVMRGFVKLKNMGLDPGEKALTAYGNTASAMGKSLNDMVEAVADAATGEFERLKEFGIKASSQKDKVTFTFQGVKTTVAKNSKDIEAYLIKLGNTKFAGGIDAQSKTLYGQFSTLTDNFKMTAATIGAALIPHVNRLFKAIQPVIDKVSLWVQKNPQLVESILKGVAAFAAINLALSAGGFLFGGVFKIISVGTTVVNGLVTGFKYVGVVMNVLRTVFLTNPIGLIIMGIALAAFLIIKYWDKLKPFFTGIWRFIKAVFMLAVTSIAAFLINFTPVGLIFKHWDKLKPYFVTVWNAVKLPFTEIFNFVMSFGKKFYEAGANIINSIVDGIKSKFGHITETIEKVTKKIRAYLPFSPAKEGALRDIHKIKLVETIAQSIRVKPVVEAMQRVSNAAFNTGPTGLHRPQLVGIGGGSSMTVHFNFNGQSGDIVAQVKSKQREIINVLKEAQRQVDRTKF
jgi:hypothetical protein